MLRIALKSLHWATNAVLFLVGGFLVGGVVAVPSEMLVGMGGALAVFGVVGTLAGVAFAIGVNSLAASLNRRFTSAPRVRVRRTRGA